MDEVAKGTRKALPASVRTLARAAGPAPDVDDAQVEQLAQGFTHRAHCSACVYRVGIQTLVIFFRREREARELLHRAEVAETDRQGTSWAAPEQRLVDAK